MKSHQSAIAVVIAIFCATTLVGCGGEDAASGSGNSTIQVMTYPSQDYNAMIKVGISEGFFEDAGVTVSQIDQPTGLEAFQALRATKSDVTIPTMPTFAAAVEAGADSYQLFCGAQPHLFVSIMAPNDSDLPTAGGSVSGVDVLKALEGKTVGTLTPKGSGFQKLFENAVASVGVKAITYVNIGADARAAGAALQRGQLDATMAATTMTQALDATGDYKQLMLMSEQPGIPTYSELYGAAWAASKDDLERNPEKYRAFCEGVEKAATYLTGMAPDEASAALQKAIGVEANVADRVVADKIYGRYETSLPVDAIKATFESYVDAGLLKAPIADVDSYINPIQSH